MANFQEVVFLLQFIVLLCITIAKIYNAMEKHEFYNHKWAWILFSVAWMCYGVGFFTFILYYDNDLFNVMLQFEKLFIMLNTLFMFIEVLFMIGNVSQETIKAYNSKEAFASINNQMKRVEIIPPQRRF